MRKHETAPTHARKNVFFTRVPQPKENGSHEPQPKEKGIHERERRKFAISESFLDQNESKYTSARVGFKLPFQKIFVNP